MQLWNIPNAEKIYDYGSDFRENLSNIININNNQNNDHQINYLIDCKYHLNEFYLFCGNFDGRIYVFSLNDNSINHISTLQHGHTSIVRDIYINLDKEHIISIGEDSRMAFWKNNGSVYNNNNKHRSSNQNSGKKSGYHPYK